MDNQYIPPRLGSTELPLHSVHHIMKKSIPGHGRASKDSKTAMQQLLNKFIHTVTYEANRVAKSDNRNTVTGDHIARAFDNFGMGNYSNALRAYHKTYRKYLKPLKSDSDSACSDAEQILPDQHFVNVGPGDPPNRNNLVRNDGQLTDIVNRNDEEFLAVTSDDDEQMADLFSNPQPTSLQSTQPPLSESQSITTSLEPASSPELSRNTGSSDMHNGIIDTQLRRSDLQNPDTPGVHVSEESRTGPSHILEKITIPAWTIPATMKCGIHISAIGIPELVAIIDTRKVCENDQFSGAQELQTEQTAKSGADVGKSVQGLEGSAGISALGVGDSAPLLQNPRQLLDPKAFDKLNFDISPQVRSTPTGNCSTVS